MSIQVATAEGADLLWGNQKWVSTNPSRAPSHSTDDQEKLSEKTTTPILPMTNTETKKGTAATIGKKRERGEAKKTGKGKGPKCKEGKPICESDHGVHIWTERERRKKMRNMFANLHSLLPQLPPKADKSSIVDEAVSYIKTLQQTLHKLQRQKLQKLQQPPATTAGDDDMMMMMCDNNVSAANCCGNNAAAVFHTWTSTNLVLNICGDEAQFNICSPPPPAASGTIFTAACYVLEKHGIEVLSAHVSSNSDRRLLMIQARHNRSENNGGGRDHVLGADDQENVVAEIFKQAAAEMLTYLCSSPN
ncbi:unnamed protein product [Linum tenue]|uniref:BHLH domain-containing protein n=1 Tax=Linum tenue TaxID=586396 RepID=A0AAV0MLC2_9ROSI|nr:unnamed protein product [Linum tenue]